MGGDSGSEFPADAGARRVDGAGKASVVFPEKGAGGEGLAGDGGDELVAGPCHLFIFHQPQDVGASLGAPTGDIFFDCVHRKVDLATGAAALAFAHVLPDREAASLHPDS